MNKVGLLTWTKYENYGSYLQWYALNKSIESLGYDVTSIEYTPRNYKKTLADLWNESFFKAICFLCKKILTKLNRNKVLDYEKQLDRHEKYKNFKNTYFHLSKEYTTKSDLYSLNKECDTFVCGSDQIWSPLCYDPTFFLDFVDSNHRKIAYAPSIGTERFDDPVIKKCIFDQINKIDFLSIRELSGQKLVKENLEKDIPVVLDPTLLLEDKEWDKLLVSTNKSNDDDYIFCYFLGQNESYWKKIKKLSKELNLNVYVVPIFKKDFYRGFNVLLDVGPIDFIRFIKNARYVCTDSFHGTVFSLIYKKQFATFMRFKKNSKENQNARIESILKIMNLENRKVDKSSDLKILLHEIIDYNKVHETIAVYRESSISFLYNSLASSLAKKGKEFIFSITNTCCGCGACSSVCNQNAIIVKKDDKGFYKAEVENSKCIQCEMCRKVCPFYSNKAVAFSDETTLYAVSSTDKKVLLHSSSGGISYELMKHFKELKQSVTGCIYNNFERKAEFKVIDFSTDSDFDLKKFQGSKYIQSDFRNVFKDIDKIKSGLVIGLPCQISAINNYLMKNKKRDSFTLVDLICHGVPSDLLFEKYLSEKISRFNFTNTPNVLFRDKVLGWENMFISIQDSKRVRSFKKDQDLFYDFFLAGNCYSDSCYECNYRTASSADLRIGDYWGERFTGNKYGVSMVIPMTERGEFLIKELYNNQKITVQKTDIKDYYLSQQVKNELKPLIHCDLIEKLKSDSSLKDLSKEFCSVYKKNVFLSKLRPAIKSQQIIFENL